MVRHAAWQWLGAPLLVLGACRPADVPTPTATTTAPIASPDAAPPPAVAASSASAESRPPAAGDSSPGAGPVAPLPTCPVLPARAPVGFSKGRTDSGILFTSAERGTEPSLQRIQQQLDAWSRDHVRGDCDVSRSDGELLSLFCTSYFVTGNGNPRAGPTEAFTFHRTGDDWVKLSLPQMLPGAGPDPRPPLATHCAQTALSHLGELPMDDPGDGEGWLNGVEPWREGLLVEAGWRNPAGGSASCLVPWPRLGDLLGCGPLAHLLRPTLLDASALAQQPAPPLEVARVTNLRADGFESYPVFASRDPRRSALVSTLNGAIGAWWNRAKSADHFNVQCTTTLSSASLVSVLCQAGQGASAPEHESFIYRLGDGSRVSTDELLRSRPGVLQRIANRCLRQHVRPPEGDYDEVLPALPKLDPAAVGIGLEFGGVRATVRYTAERRAEPQRVVRSEPCTLSYGDLGTTRRALAKSR